MGSVYWIPLEQDVLSPVQREHEACAPHLAAVELDETRLSVELLVRTRSRVRCSCIAYATAEQRDWLMRRVDGILERLGISV
jgi:hypothetical protein